MPEYSDKALQTRDRILRSAVELFYQHGYNATGLERVIGAAGVVKGNFYYYFKSKEALAVEALRWHRERVARELGVDSGLGGGSPLQRLFTLLDGMRDQVVGGSGDCEVRGCFFGNLALEMSAASEEVRRELAVIFDNLRALMADLIAQAQQVGEVSADVEPAKTAAMVLSLLEGAVLLSKTAQNPAEIDGALDFIRGYLTR
jgi:TetR/AcrR family transcriptional repressor of nem operon